MGTSVRSSFKQAFFQGTQCRRDPSISRKWPRVRPPVRNPRRFRCQRAEIARANELPRQTDTTVRWISRH